MLLFIFTRLDNRKKSCLSAFIAYSGLRPVAIAVAGRNNYAETLLSKIKETTAKTRNTKNRIFAMSMAEPAIFVNPNTAAIIAITKNEIAQFNILTSFQSQEQKEEIIHPTLCFK